MNFIRHRNNMRKLLIAPSEYIKVSLYFLLIQYYNRIQRSKKWNLKEDSYKGILYNSNLIVSDRQFTMLVKPLLKRHINSI